MSEQTTTTFKVGQLTRNISQLRPHPDNPRGAINENDTGMAELCESIMEKGLLQPLVVTSDNLILAGHRRRVACRMAARLSKNDQLMIVPVVIRDIKPNEDPQEIMLHENMQRASLTILEEARAIYGIMQRHRLTVMDVARRLSIGHTNISQRLSILKLEPEVQAMFDGDLLPPRIASYLARVGDKEKQLKLANMVARKQITVTELRGFMDDVTIADRSPESIAGPDVTARIQRSLSRPTPSRRPGRRSHVEPADNKQLEPTRADAVAALEGNLSGSIKLHTVRSLLETVCTACGMLGSPDICRTCPLPRLIMGVVGRADK